MDEFLSKIGTGEIIPLVALTLTAVFMIGLPLGITVAILRFKLRKSELTAALKQDMLNRGMSAEEIKTVLDAGAKKF